jgi:hypothetical protein
VIHVSVVLLPDNQYIPFTLEISPISYSAFSASLHAIYFVARGDAKSAEFLFFYAERRKTRNARKMNVKKFPFFSPFRALCVEKILNVRF